MLELQILSPKPEQKFPGVTWNHEELKKEIAKAVSDYQNLVVTVESESDCKETLANLRKLKNSVEDARKDMKRRMLEPYNEFEAQVKEVEEPIDTAIQNLDTQLKEIKSMKQEAKRNEIHEAYLKGTAPEWLKLEQIWDDRWLNVTFTMDKVGKAIEEKIAHINANLEVIAGLPEYSFEAEEYYKNSLDFKGAIEKAKEAVAIQKRKEEASKNLPTTPRNGEQEQAVTTNKQDISAEAAKQPLKAPETEQPIKYTFRFEISVTKEQAAALGMFCRNQGITLTQIQ